MPVTAFGAAAGRFAQGLGEIPALVADSSSPANALAAAVKRRRTGEPFYSCVLLDDPRALVAYEYAPQLLAAAVDEDGRRRLFDALAAQALSFDNVAQSSIRTLAPQAARVLCDVAMMGHATLVRSWAEAERLAGIFGRRRDAVTCFPGSDAGLPESGAFANGDAIVVWAPGLPARHTAIFAYALRDFYLPVVIACHEAPSFPVRNVSYAQPSTAVLERAAAVLDPSIGGPATAIGLARLGLPLAVTVPSGAVEYVEGATPYEPWNWRSIHAAAQRALGGARARVRSVPSAAEVAGRLVRADGALLRDGPLVSAVLPSYNRRHLLPRALDALSRQTYGNLEIVVVNDGGEAIDDIVARHPKARLIENPRNLGITGATNRGLREARGTFIAFCSDDDFFYPDAFSRFAGALARGSARVVHGNTVMRFDRRPAPGRTQTTGYQLIWKESVDHRDSLYTPHTTLACSMLHREVFDVLGEFEDTAVMDIEFFLRVSRRYDFVHVDHPCVEIEYDPAKGQGKRYAEMAAQLEIAYARFPTDSADVEAGRRSTLDWYARAGAAGFFFEPEMPLPEPETNED